MKTISNFEFRISNFSSERGVALVVVLWIFIFLFVVAFDFSSSVREEGAAAHRYIEEAEGYYLAFAGLEEALLRFLESTRASPQAGRALPGTEPQEIADGTWHEGSLGQGLYRFRLVDEGSKINLNRVDEETLRRIFANLGVEEPRRSILADSILDWRDDDNLHRTNGAEDDYYLSLVPPYTAKNGPFETVEDLLWVRGMTAGLFYGLEEGGTPGVGFREIFTVDNPTDRINARTLSPEVCHALLGSPLEKCRAFVEERKKLAEKTLADVLKLLGLAAGDAMLRRFVFSVPSMVTIEAAGSRGGSATWRQVKATVRVVGDQRRFELVRWVDRDRVTSNQNAN